MKVFLLLVVLLLCGVSLAKYAFDRPPLRGMGQEGASDTPVLVSRVRPAAAFAPARAMRLMAAGWCSLSPETRLSLPGNGRLWFAAYEDRVGLLITALAEAEESWYWEAAHHTPFPVLRDEKIPYKGEVQHNTLYVLAADADPFRTLKNAGQDEPCLVYRAKILLAFQHMQVIAEYHEPLPAEKARNIAYDLPYLNAFQERGKASCAVLLPGKNKEDVLPAHIARMDTADKGISRSKLSRWTGEMQRPGGP